jgi:phosphoribosylaminoimidazole-succinocarboxamide synthase
MQELIFQDVYGQTCLKDTHFPWPKYSGKVRDIYDLGEKLLLISTDRLSAFDRAIALIPHKGVLLNQLSAWWFARTEHIIANHVLKIPAPPAMIVKKCTPLAIEMVVRGYITGSTNTALWTLYSEGQREFFGTILPDKLSKNSRLPAPILTPTSKDKEHDRPLALKDLAHIPQLTPALWQQMSSAALKLFNFASELLLAKGLILVDTKYEFGLDEQGKLLLIDELHTSDSSRYWDHTDWLAAMQSQREPKSFDKELIRLWYKAHSNPYEDAVLPEAPAELIDEVSQRYLMLYERITGMTIKEEHWSLQSANQLLS